MYELVKCSLGAENVDIPISGGVPETERGHRCITQTPICDENTRQSRLAGGTATQYVAWEEATFKEATFTIENLWNTKI